MDITLTCNTEDAELAANIAASSVLALPWVKSVPAHDGHAVIVGGGPSLAKNMYGLRQRIAHGQTVFALNGAAGYLNREGIVPDYQVILDARQETSALKARAHEHLIASQCHPDTFDGLKRVSLWHANIDGIEEHLPAERPAYALIGGGPTVGLSAMNLAYALGYRTLHLYAYDSSHAENADHAYDQPGSLRDPVCTVTLGGKSFISTLAMVRQAERFPEVCDNLIDAGCTITNTSEGLIMVAAEEASNPMSEAEKYRKMWDFPQYREFSPGARAAEEFVALGIGRNTHVIDFGCGSGKGGAAIHAMTDGPVTLVDFAANSVDAGNNLPFVEFDLTRPMDIRGDVGFCTDVMEHIPPEDVATVIANIMACVPRCFFKIALFADNMGALIGHPLHLSVFPPEWWAEKFADFETLVSRTDTDATHPYLTVYVQRR